MMTPQWMTAAPGPIGSLPNFSIPSENVAIETSGDVLESSDVATTGGAPRLHCIAAACQRQGLTVRTAAKRMGIERADARAELDESFDLPVSALYRWQQALGVPVAELLTDVHDPLSPPIQQRAQLVRVMKTARAILETTKETPVRRMAETLVDELESLMPELSEIPSWREGVPRRANGDVGRIMQFPISDDLLGRHATEF